MELAELVAARPVPCAGLLLTVTPRCPMTCAHCSSSANMDGRDPAAAHLRRFVGSFDSPTAGPALVADGTFPVRPEVLLMTGGEPMLRPALVAELAGTARRAGTRSAVLTGAFFARDGRLPDRIRTAVLAVDHVSVSVDAFHEREVPRTSVFRLLRHLLDIGVPVSVHAAGNGPDDPYLADLVAATARAFADRVPMLVNTIRPIGRAAGAVPANSAAPDRRVLPCSMAAWPVVAGDGTVVACCNQDTVDRRPVPAHLRLGHVAVDDWAAVRDRALGSPVLRMLRTTGPHYLWDAHSPAAPDRAAPAAAPSPAGATPGAGAGADSGTAPDRPGYCGSCRRLGERPGALATAERIAAGPAGELLDRRAARMQAEAGPVVYLRRHACARYAHLITPPAGPTRDRAGSSGGGQRREVA
ncbi:radical SAM protein [Plantactinospora sp. WMMB334]|uniref:radical SAM protein n=1 Tax=Plantactinospora sp. WMMB334 TaxID=3404119 RepID=UPI003B95F51D